MKMSDVNFSLMALEHQPVVLVWNTNEELFIADVLALFSSPEEMEDSVQALIRALEVLRKFLGACEALSHQYVQDKHVQALHLLFLTYLISMVDSLSGYTLTLTLPLY
jgi:hypothetical protein